MTDATPATSTTATGGFLEKLRRRWHDGRTLLCVGLDPELETAADRAEDADVETALFTFNMAIVDATADLVCAYKPNAAFYERHGAAGWNALARTIAYIHSRYPDVPVLVDAKRGDMGNTAQAYADAIFDTLDADAVTLHPYLGSDALQPFLKRADRGCFILSHTSNPGASEFQDLTLRAADGTEEPLYLAVARTVARRWNTQWQLRAGGRRDLSRAATSGAPGGGRSAAADAGHRRAGRRSRRRWSASGWIARARGC